MALPKESGTPSLPTDRADHILTAIDQFIRTESVGGIVLVVVTAITLLMANLPYTNGILAVFDIPLGIEFGEWRVVHSMRDWINDGLLTLFFFVVGLEIKRELVIGELSTPGSLRLPLIAAAGGMFVPALIYIAFLGNTTAASGWGIVVATDIAFVVGCLALFGRYIPNSLRILMIAIAIFDDIGAILVIAIAYGHNIELVALLASIGIFGFTWAMQWMGIRAVAPYWVVGILFWCAMLVSGIHPTLAGVALGLLTPAKSWVGKNLLNDFLVWAQTRFSEMPGEDFDPALKAAVRSHLALASRESIPPLIRLEHALHPLSAFLILPLFAMANSGIEINTEMARDPIALVIMLSLVIGKPVGILLSIWLTQLLGISKLPAGINWGALFSACCLMGIGFTMSIFIATQAFSGSNLVAAKTGVLMASIASAVIGCAFLTAHIRWRRHSIKT